MVYEPDGMADYYIYLLFGGFNGMYAIKRCSFQMQESKLLWVAKLAFLVEIIICYAAGKECLCGDLLSTLCEAPIGGGGGGQ